VFAPLPFTLLPFGKITNFILQKLSPLQKYFFGNIFLKKYFVEKFLKNSVEFLQKQEKYSVESLHKQKLKTIFKTSFLKTHKSFGKS
jgi:hypothetical protein